jgi:hypothetical protein
MTTIEQLRQILDEYMQLIGQSSIRESALQNYLKDHPILLEPSHRFVHSQFRLGAEYVADFVIETYDSRYKVVEIEKSTDELYLNNGDPSSALTHAEQQVLDWQAWIRQNIAYLRYEAKVTMNDPEGLVIIGQRSQMSEDDIQRLAGRNLNMRGRLEVITFDDLSTQFSQLIDNIEKAAPNTNSSG